MVQLHSVETELLQLLASQEHTTEDHFDQKHPDPQQEPQGNTREVHEEEEGRKGGKRKLEKGSVQELLAHSVNFSTADDKVLFLTKAWE